MSKKETIYAVSSDDNLIIRASRTLLSALEFSATLEPDSYYLCTSEFNALKKGDPMSNIESFL